jgi:hypothetical protein
MRLGVVIFVAVLVAACGASQAAPATPTTAELVRVVTVMPAWAEDPLAAAGGQPATCARLDELAARSPQPAAAPAPSVGIAEALAHFVASCRAYERALAYLLEKPGVGQRRPE